MALKLTYIGETTVPVEIENFTPTWAVDKSLDQIKAFEIYHGNRKLPLAEFFDVEGDSADHCFDFHGDLSGVHWIGAHMDSGEIHIHGNAGRHVGSEMTGGTIHVHGDAGDWVGAEMKAGLIHVHGNAGHLVGAAYRGSTKGMCGGTILVDSNAGNEIGLTMRRGTIVIGGNAGDVIGFNMIAGTVIVLGESGIRHGAGMRRGTIALLGGNSPKNPPPKMLPSFKYACTAQPQFVSLLLREIRALDFAIPAELLAAQYDLYHGDMVALGRGEVLVRHAA
ncbi:formylmethanofuran dehydrogenase subunit C [Adhaeretor mobilis]|uniref:Formyltransferase/hydrolase complex Fhc subunit C n=1 Tax=Adhaeretor mobilis TaxID=1930276 RepID=A0A517MPP0_9BACT|nr:formylmethanofuran dehydrogenase subunit C [Adhaeretor mobilis]QDS96850.1 Formyltransferase/hydrolase complex Fhc subunit C [Adhaeretor mobilis]